jgi:microcompartment protein CcmL/EutN
VETGKAAASRVGEVISTSVIASPHADMDQMI